MRGVPLSACVVAAAAAAAGPARASEAEVEAAFQSVQRAVEARDAGTLERLVDPRFEMLHGLGQREGRATWLALVARGGLPRQRMERREWDTKITLFGPVAVRSWIVRLRDPKVGRDNWARGTVTFVRGANGWRQVLQQSSFLLDAPTVEQPSATPYLGEYGIPGRDGFVLVDSSNLLRLRWANGAELPLIGLGPDRFAAGPSSTMLFARDAQGEVTGVTRSGPEGPWFTATRVRAASDARRRERSSRATSP